MAAEESKWDLVKYFIEEKGADFNVRGKNGKTTLHIVAQRGDLDLVKYLIEEKGAGMTKMAWAWHVYSMSMASTLIYIHEFG